ncbi:hypothetical protein GCM10010123_05800 [Pilimelia anulata]|uniref:Capsule biosynthesis protein capC n=1 Tax=Pilimelia anulata TaxID=53371 RepID=A0A8J3B385_9ACTN|nr:poly-gamma-glutamate biosynthesis protein PgsC/CapC [Pilimelia anulata]GGJ78727.1 hypothetical protein GCM10010123_05800 [Pilimelia anulata]
MFGTAVSPQLAAIGLGLGLIFALVCYLATNLSPGGMITPGWVAVSVLTEYRQTLVIAGMTVLTYLATKAVQRVTILYGKRLFAAVVLLGVVLQLSLYLLIQRDLPLLFEHQTLGFIAPGLISYQLLRQPPVPTLAAVVIVSGITFAGLAGGILFGLAPGR